jgi:hypothetical protein
LDGAAKARGAPKLPAAADATREEIQRDDRIFIIEVMTQQPYNKQSEVVAED